MQAYFLKKLAVNDLRSMRELVRVNCLDESGGPQDQISIDGVFTGYPFEYKNAAMNAKKAQIV